MGKKKDKKKKKGLGKEKTEAKMAKKEAKRKRKKGEEGAGEEDIDDMLGKLKLEKGALEGVQTTICDPPSARCLGSLVTHPTEDKLILFGGEKFDGQKHDTYADLFVYNIGKNEWSRVESNNSPLPRSSHQAVVCPRMGGQMWVLGGEFTSPKGEHRQYDELWLLNLKSMEWERMKIKRGPSSRSGHRAIVHKNKIFVYGGFKDSGEFLQYLDDLFVLDLETMEWSKVEKKGQWPSPRAGHQLFLHESKHKAYLYGGVCMEGKGDSARTVNLTDTWELDLEAMRWQQVRSKGDAPSPRSGSAHVIHKERALVLGGFTDEISDDKKDDDIITKCHGDSYSLSLGSLRWSKMSYSNNGPTPRRHAQVTIKGNNWYVFGGVFDTNSKEASLSDMYVLDVRKDVWKCLIECDATQAIWYESGDDDDEHNEFDDFSGEDAEEGDDVEDAETEFYRLNPLVPQKGEAVKDYFLRTKDHWMKTAEKVVSQSEDGGEQQEVDDDDEEAKKAAKKAAKERRKQQRKIAFEFASEHYETCEKPVFDDE